MTMLTTGEMFHLTPRGAETIALLRLNGRRELVDARRRSWHGVIRVLNEASRSRAVLNHDDVEDLRFLPVVDAFHHFVHDVSVGRLRVKAVPASVAEFAARNVSVFRTIFPACDV